MTTVVNPPLTSPVLLTTSSGVSNTSPPQILALQSPVNVPTTGTIQIITNGLNIPPRSIDRLRNFPEEVYSLNSTDVLVRFLMTLLGQAGAGQWRTRALRARLSHLLQGANFYELDGFYGSLFGLGRMSSEIYPLNPYTDLATFDTWSGVYAQDASYRTRIAQFGRAISMGASAIGMQMIAEAVLQVPCEIVESWEAANTSHRTWGDVEGLGTYGDLEAYTWGELEIGPAVLNIDRKIFTVIPYRPISQEESYALMQVLNVVKPADAVAIIETNGFSSSTEITIRGVAADSSYWQLIESIIPNQQYANLYNLSSTPDSFGYFEVLHPPFSEYQGEEIVYNPDISGLIGYTLDADGNILSTSDVGAVTFLDGTILYYPPTQAAATRYFNAAGRLGSDGILVSAPYSADQGNVSVQEIVAKTVSQAPVNIAANQAALPQTLYADGIAIPDLISALDVSGISSDQTHHARGQSWKLQIATNNQNYWASPQRSISDTTTEVVEVRLVGPRLINNISCSVAHYPQSIMVQAWDATTSEWETIETTNIYNSTPNVIPTTPPILHEDPQHNAPGHWDALNLTIDPITTSKIRFLMTRISNGNGPVVNTLSLSTTAPIVSIPIPYSLAMQNLTLGYNVYEQADLPTSPIFTSDFLESQVEWDVRQESPDNTLSDNLIPWRSSPQVAADAVVNFYLDTRDYTGAGQLLDRFFVDPTYNDVHCTLYYSDVSTADLVFDAEATELTPPTSNNIGSIIPTAFGQEFPTTDVSYIDIENTAVQFDPNGPWWWGTVFTPNFSSPQANGQTIWDTGEGLSLTIQPLSTGVSAAAITVTTADTKTASTNIVFTAGDTVYTTVVFLPEGSNELQPGIYVFASTNMSETEEIISRYALGLIQRTVAPVFDTFNSSENLFGYYKPSLVVSNPVVNLQIGAAFVDPIPFNGTLMSMVIKQVIPTIEQINSYSNDYSNYTVVSPYIGPDPTENTTNSIVRFNPSFISTENPTGMLGGPGYFYPQLPWTPVVRDYVLQKGFMFFNPTKAKFWKFEFTNLSAQAINSFVAIKQPYQTHNGIGPALVQQQQPTPVNDPGNPPSGSSFNQSSVVGQSLNFSDSPGLNIFVTTTSTPNGSIAAPTSTQVAVDQNVQTQLANSAWYWQYQEWYPGLDAPRFISTTVHNYNSSIQVQSSQVGYFVGLNALKAYRLDFGSNDDTEVYDVTFADDTYINPTTLTWDLNPYDMFTTGVSSFPTVCQSESIISTTPIIGLQFATSQSDAIQIVNDDQFQSPLLISTDWLDTDIAHAIGDALTGYTQLSYQPDTNSITVYRNFSAGTVTMTPQQQGTIVRPDVHPIFDEATLVAPASGAPFFGGVASAITEPGTEGNVWAAVRLTVDNQLDQPLTLQLIDFGSSPDFTPTVLASKEFTASPGQIVEETLGYELGSVISAGNPIYAQIVQFGNTSASSWTVSRLSIFDEGIVWKFSIDGGATFIDAFEIKNNAYGIMTFANPSTQLLWRVEGTRPNVHVNGLRIRPVYLNQKNLPPEAVVQGANVSLYGDHYPPIEEDPLFNGWNNPVPFWWFLGYEYSLLAVSGVPNTNAGSSFYVRVAGESLTSTDSAHRDFMGARTAEDHTSVSDDTEAAIFTERTGGETTSVSDSATAIKVFVPGASEIVEPIVFPHDGEVPSQ